MFLAEITFMFPLWTIHHLCNKGKAVLGEGPLTFWPLMHMHSPPILCLAQSRHVVQAEAATAYALRPFIVEHRVSIHLSMFIFVEICLPICTRFQTTHYLMFLFTLLLVWCLCQLLLYYEVMSFLSYGRLGHWFSGDCEAFAAPVSVSTKHNKLLTTLAPLHKKRPNQPSAFLSN